MSVGQHTPALRTVCIINTGSWVRGEGKANSVWGPAGSGPVLGGTRLLDSDITPEHRLLQCVRPSLSNLEHYSGRNVGAVMFQVRQQKSKGLAQAVFRKTTSGNHPRLDQTARSSNPLSSPKLAY